jgi:uncharacterized phosphosugar-binding protein
MRPPLSYPQRALTALNDLLTSQADNIWMAAEMIVDSYRHGGILQVYGTGHSRIVTLEFAARAGGLAPVGMLAVKDLVMFGGVAPEEILDPTYERESGIASRIYDLASPQLTDVFLIVSNSGINSAIVEMAALVKERGHKLIVITSREHSGSVASRDRTGRNLSDIADLVIDNGAPAGDAAVEIAPGVRIGALSSLTGVFTAQLVSEAVCRVMLDRGEQLPVLLSANLPEGGASNKFLKERYRDRIRPIEP